MCPFAFYFSKCDIKSQYTTQTLKTEQLGVSLEILWDYA